MPEKAKGAELTALQAVERYERAVKEAPDNGENFLDLGAAYYIAHRWDEAVGAFEQAVRLRPDLGHAHYYLGVLYAARGDKERARQELESVVKLGNNPILVSQAKARIPEVDSLDGLAAGQ
jgi:Flp pilus assembly protein TadD